MRPGVGPGGELATAGWIDTILRVPALDPLAELWVFVFANNRDFDAHRPRLARYVAVHNAAVNERLDPELASHGTKRFDALRAEFRRPEEPEAPVPVGAFTADRLTTARPVLRAGPIRWSGWDRRGSATQQVRLRPNSWSYHCLVTWAARRARTVWRASGQAD